MPRRKVSEEERLDAILSGAAKLFRDQGVAAVSIDEIVAAAGIAKGTFYLYFRSKDALLAALAERLVEQMATTAEAAGAVPAPALDRFAVAVGAMRHVDQGERYLAEALDRPENGALHERANVALVRRLGPVLADIVETGKSEGVFDVEDALSTVQFLLAGQATLLGGGRFDWTEAEYLARLKATLTVIERALGAERNALVSRLGAALAGSAKHNHDKE